MFKRILAVSLVVSMAMTSFAQRENMEAFRNLGVGVEVGVMGSGIQVAVPVVSNHLVAVVGFNSYALYGLDKIDYDFDLSAGRINSGIKQLNSNVDDFNAKPENAGNQIKRVSQSLPENFTITLNGKLSPNYKILLEYYPSQKSSFHITGGLMFGSKSFFSLSGDADDNIQKLYDEAIQVQTDAQNAGAIAKSDNLIYDKLQYSFDHRTFAIKERVRVEGDIEMNAVRPYLGLGFGRSIPGRRVGFQFEIGAWYHGGLNIGSPNEIEYDDWASVNEDVDDVIKTFKSISIFPQMTFRLTGRIF